MTVRMKSTNNLNTNSLLPCVWIKKFPLTRKINVVLFTWTRTLKKIDESCREKLYEKVDYQTGRETGSREDSPGMQIPSSAHNVTVARDFNSNLIAWHRLLPRAAGNYIPRDLKRDGDSFNFRISASASTEFFPLPPFPRAARSLWFISRRCIIWGERDFRVHELNIQ